MRVPVLQRDFLASCGADVLSITAQPLGCHEQLPCACLGGGSCCYPEEELLRSSHVRGLDGPSDVEPDKAVVLIVLKAINEFCPQYSCQDPLAGSQVVQGQTLRGVTSRTLHSG